MTGDLVRRHLDARSLAGANPAIDRISSRLAGDTGEISTAQENKDVRLLIDAYMLLCIADLLPTEASE